jgi:hypothetical protein
MKHTNHKVLWMSVIYFLTAFCLLFVTTYAWFILTNINDARLISNISDVEAEYEFYRFKDSWHNGDPNRLLPDTLCSVSLTDQCYDAIPNPTTMFEYKTSVGPGDRFSFALRIVSIGFGGYLNLDLGRVQSLYAGHTRIQDAFLYEITKVSYVVDDVESSDQKDVAPTEIHSDYFTGTIQTIYPLIHHLPMNPTTETQVIILIYFDIYYDPTLTFLDPDGLSYPNYNHFAHQMLQIEDIYMMISPSQQ